MSDEELERQYRDTGNLRNAPIHTSAPPTAGFLAFARLSRMAGKIHQLSSPVRMRELTSTDPNRSQKFLARALKYDEALRTWSDSLPASLRFSVDEPHVDSNQSQDLGVNVVNAMVHAGSLINLYRYVLKRKSLFVSLVDNLKLIPRRRCFVGNTKAQSTAPDHPWISHYEAVAQCTNAAKSCIKAARLIADYVPPSQYFAICIHYLTLSGVVLYVLPHSPQIRLW